MQPMKKKTTLENEQKLLVDGIKCAPDIAARQMIDTKEFTERPTALLLTTHIFLSSRESFHPKKHSSKTFLTDTESVCCLFITHANKPLMTSSI